MNRWKLVLTEPLGIPVRSAGNTVVTQEVTYRVYRDGAMYKGVPECSPDQKRLANLKDEVTFIFRPDKAVSTNGILDSNQHIVERLGMLLREKGIAEKSDVAHE